LVLQYQNHDKCQVLNKKFNLVLWYVKIWFYHITTISNTNLDQQFKNCGTIGYYALFTEDFVESYFENMRPPELNYG